MSNDPVNDTAMEVDGLVLDGECWSAGLAFELVAAAGIRKLSVDRRAVLSALRPGYTAGDPDRFPQIRKNLSHIDMREDGVCRLFGNPLVASRAC